MNVKVKDSAVFIVGVLICFGVAVLSVFIEGLIPGEMLGASIIALFMGTIINSFFHPKWIKKSLKFTSKRVLKIAIILLGASLSVSTIRPFSRARRLKSDCFSLSLNIEKPPVVIIVASTKPERALLSYLPSTIIGREILTFSMFLLVL